MPESVSHLRGGQKRLEAAWDRFNAAQAEREEEIRRPAKKIDVMSEDEYQRIQTARGQLVSFYNSLRDHWDEQYNRISKRYIRAFFNKYHPDITSLGEESLSRIVNWVSVMIVECSIVLSDPYFPSHDSRPPSTDPLKDIPGYRSVEGSREELLKGILMERLHFSDGPDERNRKIEMLTKKFGGYPGFYDWNIQSAYGMGLSHDFKKFDTPYLVRNLKSETQSDDIWKPKDQELAKWIFEDEEREVDFGMVINMIVMASLLKLKAIGAGASRMCWSIPEGTGNGPIQDELDKIKKLIEKDAKSQKIWQNILEMWEDGKVEDNLQLLIDDGLKKAVEDGLIH